MLWRDYFCAMLNFYFHKVNYSSKTLKTFSSVHHLQGDQKFVLPKDTQRKRLFSSFCASRFYSVLAVWNLNMQTCKTRMFAACFCLLNSLNSLGGGEQLKSVSKYTVNLSDDFNFEKISSGVSLVHYVHWDLFNCSAVL